MQDILLTSDPLVAFDTLFEVNIQVNHGVWRPEKAERSRSDGRVAPTIAIYAAARVHCVQEVTNLWRLPPRNARHENITVLDSVCTWQWEHRLHAHRGCVMQQPCAKCC